MSSMQVIDKLFVGPAVVVDDNIDRDNCTMQPIVEQIEAQNIPVYCKKEPPSPEELRHWRSFSLIVLDWELYPDSQGAGALPPGVSRPERMSKDNDAKVSDFVKNLLATLYAPIFIFSDQSVDNITTQLINHLSMDEGQLRERVMIRSKSDMSASLFETLTDWLSVRPAIYALKNWDYSYEEAKKGFFDDLHASSPNWPKCILSASDLDNVNPHFELSEMIARNIIHRFQPLVFDASVFESKGDSRPELPDALRRVVHRQAVIANESLHKDMLMPGDFFFSRPDKGLPSEILINVTPACDLVPRKGTNIDEIEMTLIRAHILSDGDYKTVGQHKDALKDYLSSHVLFVLTDSAWPYKVQFKNWTRRTWGALREERQGRLLEPYITLLQQKFALYFHRQGLPRLPDRYFVSLDEAKLGSEKLADEGRGLGKVGG